MTESKKLSAADYDAAKKIIDAAFTGSSEQRGATATMLEAYLAGFADAERLASNREADA